MMNFLLPDPLSVQVYLGFAWALVLSSLLLAGLARWFRLAPLWKALCVGLVLAICIQQGPWSPTYWLGLAFQAPSLCSALLCAHWLRESLRSGPAPVLTPNRVVLPVLLAMLVLGWLLLLDMLAWLPFSLYALGFGPWAAGLLLLLGLLPVVLQGSAAWRDPRARVLPAAVVLFVLSRWPSGNVWDAVLDPWLWLVLHGYAFARWRRAG